jgi:hypothetical protein
LERRFETQHLTSDTLGQLLCSQELNFFSVIARERERETERDRGRVETVTERDEDEMEGGMEKRIDRTKEFFGSEKFAREVSGEMREEKRREEGRAAQDR